MNKATTFSKAEENYIEHEVQLRLHDAMFENMNKANDLMFQNMNKANDVKFQNIDKAIDRLDAAIKHLDNKLMLMFSIVLGSIWLPAILHYLHVT